MKRSIALVMACCSWWSWCPPCPPSTTRSWSWEKMRSNGALFGQLNAAVGSGDYYTAALRLVGLAENARRWRPPTRPRAAGRVGAGLRGSDPGGLPRGRRLRRAERGKAQAEVAAIGALMKEGHTKFR